MGFGETLAIDSSGDLVEQTRDSGGKTLKIIDGPLAVAQRLRIRLGTIQGENELFPDMGLPREAIVGSFDRELLRAEIREEVTKDPAVSSIQNINVRMLPSNRINRVADVSVSVRLNDGNSITVSTQLRA